MVLLVQKCHVSTEVGFIGIALHPHGLLLDGDIVCITKLVDFVWRCIFTIGHPGYSTLWAANNDDVSEKPFTSEFFGLPGVEMQAIMYRAFHNVLRDYEHL